MQQQSASASCKESSGVDKTKSSIWKNISSFFSTKATGSHIHWGTGGLVKTQNNCASITGYATTHAGSNSRIN